MAPSTASRSGGCVTAARASSTAASARQPTFGVCLYHIRRCRPGKGGLGDFGQYGKMLGRMGER